MRLMLLLALIFVSSVHSFTELRPAPLLQLDPQFSHHVIVAEKSTHKLHIFRNHDGEPKLVKTYLIATGKKTGNKKSQGDHRTPEGIYYLTQFLTHSDLVTKHGKQGEIYGVGAFVLNYPNPIDNIKEKTGGGIWLHSTNDETRIDKGLDSRGCVVSGNQDLIEISQYIELHKTPMIVVHNLNYLSNDAWNTLRSDISSTISIWRKAWQEENLDDYIAQYHPQFQSPKLNGLEELRSYKSAIFKQKGVPQITLENVNIFHTKDYARVTFEQQYSSSAIQDIGRKTLYLKRDEFYKWRIISENWSKNGIDKSLKITHHHPDFKPSHRFFTTTNPKKIMGDKLLYTKNTAE